LLKCLVLKTAIPDVTANGQTLQELPTVA